MRAQPKEWRIRSYRKVGEYKLVRTTDVGNSMHGVQIKNHTGTIIHTSWEDDARFDYRVLTHLTHLGFPVGVTINVALMLGWEKFIR